MDLILTKKNWSRIQSGVQDPERNKTYSRLTTPDFRAADFGLLRDLLRRIP